MMTKSIPLVLVPILLALIAVPAPCDGGFFSSLQYSVAISADLHAIIAQSGDEIAMTLSTGYTGDGADFGWIIPTPVPPEIEDVFESGEDGFLAFTLLDEFTAPVFKVKVRKTGFNSSSCFPAGTPVLTPEGPQAIETIEAGVMVEAYDLEYGIWKAVQVRRKLTHRYEGNMIIIRAGEATVTATGNHPFFVSRGEDLSSRPRPTDIPVNDPGGAGDGRWVEARDLRIGDALFARDGDNPEVTALSSHQQSTDVYNLEVEELHSYAVGREGFLVHNKGASDADDSVGETPVTVHGTVITAHYEVSVLEANSSRALLDWLDEHEYNVDPQSSEIIDAYIQDGWSFTAVKLNPWDRHSRYDNEPLPPITLRYRYDRLIFPLRISSISTAEEAAITLYILAESTVTPENYPSTRLIYDYSLKQPPEPSARAVALLHLGWFQALLR